MNLTPELLAALLIGAPLAFAILGAVPTLIAASPRPMARRVRA